MIMLLRYSAFFFSLLLALPASAAPRTFVSSTGVDTNPCSITAPCRSLQAAINAVNQGGEVVVLDSAGYGTLDISKAVQVIVPPGIHAAITANATNGVTIHGGVADVIVLRGLYLDASPIGISGIAFNSGKALHVENCVITGFGDGIFFNSSGQLEIKDTIVRENTVGVSLSPGGAGIALATLDRVRLERNIADGLFVEANAQATLRDSVLSNNSSGAHVVSITAGVSAQLTVVNSAMANNSTNGMLVGGGAGNSVVVVADSAISDNSTGLITQTGGTLRVSNSTISQNGTGVLAPAGTLLSRGNNSLVSNTVDGTFTGTFLAQ